MDEAQADTSSPNQANSNSDPNIQTASVEMNIPASLNFLSVLCAALREYCAALPLLLQIGENEPEEIKIVNNARSRFGTGALRLPGNNGSTIMVSYSHMVYSLELALQEAATNIVRHGYGGDDYDKKIRLLLSTNYMSKDGTSPPQRVLIVELFDTGAAFDTASATYRSPDPTQLYESGYGLYLIHKLTDRLRYFQADGYNCLQMVKFLS
jgi:anti-sigma regulatory factor (Ser/Thr protein kinase)